MINLEFVKQVNEYVIESILEASEEEILSLIDSLNYPTSEEIAATSQLVQQAIQLEKRRRLERNKAEFAAYEKSRENAIKLLQNRPVASMIADIVSTMQKGDGIPQGVLLAFREQQESTSDEDIALIWQSLVELGLIDPYEDDNKP